MFEISDRAARQIAEACRRRDAPAGGFRIRRDPAGGDDALNVGFIARPEPGDHVFAKDDATVYVADDALDAVDGWELDSRTIEHRTTLYLRPLSSSSGAPGGAPGGRPAPPAASPAPDERE